MTSLRTAVVAASLIAATLAWSATRTTGTDPLLAVDCRTAADVARHASRSREGVSPSCNETIRAARAERARSAAAR